MKAIVLGAGKGTRLQSEQHHMPKVLRQANGKPLIEYVLKSIDFISPQDTVIVVGYRKEMVMQQVGPRYQYAVQEEQKGTGHAVQMAYETLRDYDGDLLILYGDMPLFNRSTYQDLIQAHRQSGADCTVLSAQVDKPLPYGRILRDQFGNLMDIIEEKDCTPEQKKIAEMNVGIYVFKSKLLFENLKLLDNHNAQQEYFLTSVPKIMIEKGLTVKLHKIEGGDEIYGVNTPEDLAFCEKVLKQRNQNK